MDELRGDIMPTHWKKLTNPDYLGAYAFDPNEEKTGTIHHVAEEKVTGIDGKSEMCTVAYFAESDLKPLILNVTNCKAITRLYNTPYIEEWAGKAIVMKVQAVKAFGETVDAVRIKPTRPVLICSDCKKDIQPFSGKTAAQIMAYTRQKFGKCLCAACAGRKGNP